MTTPTVHYPESPLPWASSVPYSQAVVVGDLAFLAGQGPFDDEGKVPEGDFESQVHLTFANLEKTLKSVGSDLSSLLRLTLVLTNTDDYKTWHRVRLETLKPPYPATAGFIGKHIDPAVRIEIVEGIAVVRDRSVLEGGSVSA